MFAAGLSAFAASLGGAISEEAPTFNEPGWWFAVNLTVGFVCFCAGSWNYTRDSEPCVTPARAVSQGRRANWVVVVIAVFIALVLLGAVSTFLALMVAGR